MSKKFAKNIRRNNQMHFESKECKLTDKIPHS